MVQGGGRPADVAPSPGPSGAFPALLGHLFRRALLVAHQEYHRLIGQDGISPLQFGLLDVIARNPGISQAALAEALHAAPSVVTNGLKRLLDEKMVTRVRALDDGRRMEFRPTEAGLTLHAQLSALVAEVEQVLRAKAGPDGGEGLEASLRAFLEVAETPQSAAEPVKFDD